MFSASSVQKSLRYSGHLLKPLFTLTQGRSACFLGLCYGARPRVARQVLRLRCIFTKIVLAVASQDLRFAVVILRSRKRSQPSSNSRAQSEELLNRLAYEFLVTGSKQLQSCWIRFKAKLPGHRDQDPIQRTVEDGICISVPWHRERSRFSVLATG